MKSIPLDLVKSKLLSRKPTRYTTTEESNILRSAIINSSEIISEGKLLKPIINDFNTIHPYPKTRPQWDHHHIQKTRNRFSKK